jgi:undecaprenyl-diphosphatase
LTIYESIILGVVEGITEFLPVSSTAHLILTAQLLKIEESSFLKTFEIAVQLAPILAVAVIFWSRLFSGLDLWFKLAVSFIPTGLAGLFLYDYIDSILSTDITIPLMLFTGVAFILIEKLSRTDSIDSENEISYRTALGVGIFQSLSILPGVSRSGATILGAMLLGMNRELSMRYSFLLSIPTMGVATLYTIYKDYETLQLQNFEVLGVGFLVSFIIGFGVVKLLLKIVSRYSFVPFGWYLIVTAILFYLFLI